MENHPDRTGRTAAEEVAHAWAGYAQVWFPGHSELYAQWCSRTAADPDLLALIAALPPEKRTPLLVFAAARYLGCGDVPYPRFRAFALERWEEVAGVVLGHRVQTNEPARCATLLPALALVAERERRPLALIEVGPSAGLCLLPDLYSYEYDGGPRLGSGTPLLRCATSGNPPLPDRLPEVAWRAGVDLNPLDGTDPDTVRWLEALVWPGETERLANLRAALETLRQARPRPVLERGDLNERIADLVRRAPEGSAAVVFHSAVLAYLSPPDRARFAETVRGLDCHWISNESFFLDAAGDESPAARVGYFTLSLDGTPLAHTGQHGAELHWLRD
ncbi:DUF2332 domain-containing protein [Arthrobacter ginkgonis]|uniref:DUF2332 domain-containing protein n=1 Tax=Arthrobacter ginkgonis TaxID=1630594 RepID=A0ABP7C388_9MICC